MINIDYDFNYELHLVNFIYLLGGEMLVEINGLYSTIFNGDFIFYS